MIVKLSLEKLEEENLSPNEFVVLFLLYLKKDTNFPIRGILVSLRNKGWIDEDNNIINNKVNNDFFSFNKKINISEWINDWLKLWPTNLLPSGYRVSGSSKQCITRMIKFCKDFPEYTPDIIMNATKNYLDRQESMSWSYTKKNAKFIYDLEGSTLEQECISYLNGDEKQQTNAIDL